MTYADDSVFNQWTTTPAAECAIGSIITRLFVCASGGMRNNNSRDDDDDDDDGDDNVIKCNNVR